MTVFNFDKEKLNYNNLLRDFPFDCASEPENMGISHYKLTKQDTFTALESPFTFREFKHVQTTETKANSYVDEESSSGVSSDDSIYYDNIKMEMDLFVKGFQIVDNSEATLIRNCKYGFVGRNGIGKTTILKAIRKRKFNIPRGIKIHLIKQDFSSDEAVVDFVGPESGRVLQSLGFTKDMQGKRLCELSGGWRMRAQLARAVSANPDLLLLDEPTNFLDINGISWLESQIPNLKTVIIVSHDRNFLDNTVDHILYLKDMKIQTYKGNYSSFKKQRDDSITKQLRDYENQKEQREKLQAYVDKNRASAALAKQAQSTLKVLKKMEIIELPKVEPVIRFSFGCEAVKGVLLELSGCSFRYANIEKDILQDKDILQNIDLKITNQSRIVIVGQNGQGKSTLLKLLTSQLRPQSGEVIPHKKLKVGYFAQHHLDHLDHNQYTLSLLMKEHEEEESRACLSNFGLKVNNQKIGTLSGGQKSRLAFATLSLSKPNLMIMDEPTNHLDIETIDALADSLNRFEGGVVAVSHDIAFIEKVFDEILICEEGGLRKFKGTVTEYKDSIRGDTM